MGTFFVFTPDMVSAYQDGDYTYTVSDGVATITGYTGAGGVITIPSTLGGHPAVAIGIKAFANCTSLVNIIIGSGVTSIGYGAFMNCFKLISVNIPNSVTTLGSFAFYNCTSLTSATIGNGVTNIMNFTFYYCNNLTSVTIGNKGTTKIGMQMFGYCPKLISIRFLGLVAPTTVGEYWITGTPGEIRGHAYATSNFNSTGEYWNGLLMGTYIPEFAPVFGTPSPADSSTGNPLSLTWSILINDPEGNLFSWTTQCSNGQTKSGIGQANGTKSLLLSGLAYSRTYTVWVNATDPTGIYTRGWYTFTAKSSDNNGGGGGSEPPVEPSNKNPIADASAGEPHRGHINSSITFNGSKSSDSDGTITNWAWVFGDNTNGNGKTVRHAYSKAGTYTVSLIVTDDDGATNTDTTTCMISQVNNRPPTIPTITGPIYGTKNTMHRYIAVSTDADNDMVHYTFDFGDPLSIPLSSGFLPNGSSFTVNHMWAAAGRYDFTVKVTDNQTTSSLKIMVYIDAEQTGDIGYLLDNNGDSIYDAFYSDVSKQITAVQKKDGNYNIDYDGDGDWDYTLDATKGLTSYQKAEEIPSSLLCLIIGIILVVSISLGFPWKRKSKK